MIKKLAFLLVAAWSLAAFSAEPQTLHVYHIGNSLTRSITMDRLHLLFAEHHIDYQFSTQLAAGCPLNRHWAAREKGMNTRQWETNLPSGDTFEPGGPDWDPNPKRFGPYWKALTEHKWDAIVFQPYRSHMKDDLPALRNFIRFALDNQATDQFYLYQTWPNRPAANPKEKDRSKRVYADIDYQALWEREYQHDEDTNKPSGDAFQSRDYFDKLLAKLQTNFEVPIRMIPVGEVWYECDKRIKAGELSGLAELYVRDPALVPGWKPETGNAAGVNVFYADGIHPNPIPHLTGNVANFVNGMTICTAISGKSPEELSGSVYGLDDEKDAQLIAALKRIVSNVVNTQPPPQRTQRLRVREGD
jgi:hypothetical protein